MHTESLNKKKKIGLYVHFPFCDGKCPYCDFYSLRSDTEQKEKYANALTLSIAHSREEFGVEFDTVYFGGGTPALISQQSICAVAREALRGQGSDTLREFTVECNPSSSPDELFAALARCGVNRISLGLQSSDDSERRVLGRRATAQDALRCMDAARKAGIDNISLDLILGIPGQSEETLRRSVEFCDRSGATHVSAYILKLEPGTPFYDRRDSGEFPDDERCADLYLLACELLESSGYVQYEISNFARNGFESLHNLKYWQCEEYIGLGAAAHSFVDGRRFYYPRDIEGFVAGNHPVPDGEGGSFEEYAMLRLRLTNGLHSGETQRRFHMDIPDKMRAAAKPFEEHGLLISDGEGIRLTREGFLLSNTIIARLLYEV